MTTGEVIQPLSPDEQHLKDDCERRIQVGLSTWLDVCDALATMRDKKLWRGEFESFDAYCKVRLGYGQKRASQFINAGSMAAELSASTNVELPNEFVVREIATQARKLAKDNPVKQTEVAQEIALKAAAIAATANVPLNSTHVKQAITPVVQFKDDKTRRAVVESGFSAIIQRMNKGELTPDAALALVDAIKTCEPKVRGDMLLLGTSDPAFIRLMNRKRHTETYAEIVRTGWLQAAKWQKQADKATAADLQRLLDERHQEHKYEAATLADAEKGIVEKTLTLKIGDLDYSASMLEQVYGYKNAVELAEYIIQRAKRRELETGTAYVQ